MSLIVPGLRNAGSSCYANSIFQALAPLSSFHSHLRAVVHSKRKQSEYTDDANQSSPSSSRLSSFWGELWNSLTSDDEVEVEEDNNDNNENYAESCEYTQATRSSIISREVLSLLRALCVCYSSTDHPPASLRPRIQAIGDLSESSAGYHQSAAAALVQQDAHEFLLCLLSAIAERDTGPALLTEGKERSLKKQSLYLKRWVAMRDGEKLRRTTCLLLQTTSSTSSSTTTAEPQRLSLTVDTENNTTGLSRPFLTNPLINPFRCVIGRRVVCLACDETVLSTSSWKSTREEALTLDPPQFPSSTHSIESLLSSYFSANTISGYVCNNSKCSHVALSKAGGRQKTPLEYNALRISCIQQPPIVLALHIGRLQFGHKVHTHFKFNETLSLAPFMRMRSTLSTHKNNTQELDKEEAKVKVDGSYKSSDLDANSHLLTYDLVSVVEHLGNANSGHYITYRRVSPPSQKSSTSVDEEATTPEWVVCSDGSVRNVTFAQVASCTAYMLFYEKRKDIAIA